MYFFAKLLNVSIEYCLDTTEITDASDGYLFEIQDNHKFLNDIIAEDRVEYLAPLKYYAEEEVSYLVRVFSKIQNPQIRQKIVELIGSIVASQGTNAG